MLNTIINIIGLLASIGIGIYIGLLGNSVRVLKNRVTTLERMEEKRKEEEFTREAEAFSKAVGLPEIMATLEKNINAHLHKGGKVSGVVATAKIGKV